MLLLKAFAAYQQLTQPGADVPSGLGVKVVGDISDLYIQEGERMRFRVPGGLAVFGDVVTSEEFERTFAVIRDFEQRLAASGRVEDAYDLPVAIPEVDSNGNHSLLETFTRLRMTVYRHSRGTRRAAVVRFGPEKPLALQDLYLEQMARSLLDDLRGAIFVTGPTHSGKTYTMASMLDYINRNQSGHIVTIEDPIEIPIPPDSCVVSQMEIGPDVESFAQGVLGSLRKSPIAVMVGEIREAATAQAALRVIQGGHFLLAGLHGPDSLGALRAYCSFLDPLRRDEERSQLAQRLNGVIYQVLVPSVDARNYYVACEVASFLQNPSLRTKLARGDFDGLHQAMQQDDAGTLKLNRSLIRLLQEGKVTFAEAKKVTYAPADLYDMAKKAGVV